MDYKTSGVNIDAGNKAVELIKSSVKKTFSANVLGNIGSFGGFFSMPSGLKDPILVSCTDGVGTKLKYAIETQIFDTIGIDLVAMNVNDLICSGAKPLFFLDYIACHKLEPEKMKELIDGMVEGCLQANSALIGGEMAEMNDLYNPGDFDLAGFAVGVVEKAKVIDGSKIKPGNFIYGLKSSGIHSNGYSLVRKIFTDDNLKKSGVTKKELLTPTKIYGKDLEKLISAGIEINGIAHITGGGLAENLVRVFPEGVTANIEKANIPVAKIFKIMQEVGQVQETEMWRVFNMGIGLVVITSEEIKNQPELVYLGRIEKGQKEVKLV